MNEIVKDLIGQEIKPGSIIAYGHALGRCAGLKIGKVLDVQTTRQERPGYKDYVTYRIRVRGIEELWNYKDGVRQLEVTKIGTLQFPNRMIVIDKLTLSDNYQELLDKI